MAEAFNIRHTPTHLGGPTDKFGPCRSPLASYGSRDFACPLMEQSCTLGWPRVLAPDYPGLCHGPVSAAWTRARLWYQSGTVSFAHGPRSWYREKRSMVATGAER